MKILTEREKQLYKEYHEYSIPGQPALLCRELAKRNYGRIKVLALDLEWTLTTDAISQWPRPGLFNFLEVVRELFPRVVIFTAVSEVVFRSVANNLVAFKDAPTWFLDIEYIDWPQKGKKDLSYIPGIEPHEALLVDDHFGYIHPEQLFQWISITEYETINYNWDFELNRVLGILESIQINKIKKETVLAYLEPFTNDVYSGIKKAWLYGAVAKDEANSESIIKIAFDVDPEKNAERLNVPFGISILHHAQGKFGRYFWGKVELIAYPIQDSEQKKKIDDGIMVVNPWERFCAVFTRNQNGIDIEFPDLPECKGFSPDDGGGFLHRTMIQAFEPAEKALTAWLKTADSKDVPVIRLSRDELKKQYPESSVEEISARAPWKKNCI